MTPYYDEDGITIYHADCREVLPTIDPASVGLVLTDPPYGININTDSTTTERRVNAKGWRQNVRGKAHPPVHGDDQPFNPSHLLHFRRLVLFGANNYADKLPPSQSWIVWNRLSGDSNTADAELAWTNLGGTVRMFDHLWNGLCRASEMWQSPLHPTQKPVPLMRWILDRHTQPGDLIFDPYMGSGPIAQACHEMGRRYIGVEIVEEYCEIAVQRLAQGVLTF